MNEQTAFPQPQEFHMSLRVADVENSTTFYAAFLGIGPKDKTVRYSTFIAPHLNLNLVLLVNDSQEALDNYSLYHLRIGVASKAEATSSSRMTVVSINAVATWPHHGQAMAEEALYDSRAMRTFARIDLGEEPDPDETTICKFRHLMERHNLGDQLFHLVNQYLQENGLKVNRGAIVDASIINAPSSTKNKKKQRDPEMHQTRKGNQWYFGMKAHVGVDSKTKLIHHVVATAANVHDSLVLGDLLNGNERRVGMTVRIRAKVEHVFGVMIGQLGFTKVR